MDAKRDSEGVGVDGADRLVDDLDAPDRVDQSDVMSVDSAGSWADAVLRLIPDPVVCLDPKGHVRSGSVVESQVFDPCRDLRAPGDGPDANEVKAFQELVATTLEGAGVRTAHFAAGWAPDDHRVEARLVPTGTGDVLCIVRDVTELHQVESALAEQVAFESLVASVSSRLIGGTTTALDEATVSGLGEIAMFFGADAAVIRELSGDGGSLHVLYHWSRLPHHEPSGRIEVIESDWLVDGDDRATHLLHVNGEDPGSFGVPRELEDTNAVLWARLGHNGDLRGILVLKWYESRLPLREESLSLVRVAADAFYGALRRREIAVLAEGQSEVFESIARGEPVESSLAKARKLLARSTLGGQVVLLTASDGQLHMVNDDAHPNWPTWFAHLSMDPDNPFGRAVISGEPVAVVDVIGDLRFRGPIVPDRRHRSVSVHPVRSPREGATTALFIVFGHDPEVVVPPRGVLESAELLVTVALEREADLRQLAHEATHDPLTGVGNRSALLDRLRVTLARAQRSGSPAAVIYCDLDGFKAVNDELGHDRGDRLLVEVARRIREAVRPDDTVSRVGGDEFVVVCEDLENAEQGSTIVQRIYAAVEDTPVDLGEEARQVRISVGVALADPDHDDPDSVMRAADRAMYDAKARDRVTRRVARTVDVKMLEPVGRPRLSNRFLRDLHYAVTNGTLALFQQPIVRRDGVPVGVESLLRWPHDDYKDLGPERIVSAATEMGMAVPLGRWVRTEALAARVNWPRPAGSRTAVTWPPVHVNVSAAEVVAPEFVATLVGDLQTYAVGPRGLVLEVREADLHRADVLAVIDDLHRAGVTMIIDGVGHDGLALADLAELPVQGIKLGRPLVQRLDYDEVAIEVARSLVLLAHGLGWRSLAVGVETHRQRSVLFGFGIDAVQGRAVSMPVSEVDFGRWLVDHDSLR